MGHLINERGISPDPAKTSAIANYPAPRNVKELKQFLGLASYYRKFVKNFAMVAAPLTSLLKLGNEFRWGQLEAQSFEKLIVSLSSPGVLDHFDELAEITLKTDASYSGIGAVLSQKKGNEERVASFLVGSYYRTS